MMTVMSCTAEDNDVDDDEGFAGPLEWSCVGRALRVHGVGPTLVKARNGFADGAAVCRAELRPDVASGVFNWEVIVLERQHEYATSVFVGVCAAARARDVGRSTHALYANSGAGCWTINCATGGLWGGGARNAHAAGPVRAGDRLGWVLDTHRRTLRFFLNGSAHGPGFECVCDGGGGGGGGGALLPFVELYGEGESVELCGGVSWAPAPGSTLVFPWRPTQGGSCECQARRAPRSAAGRIAMRS